MPFRLAKKKEGGGVNKKRQVYLFFNNDATMDKEMEGYPSAVADALRIGQALNE